MTGDGVSVTWVSHCIAGVTRRPRYREALIEVSISVNAALAAYTLQQEIGRRDLGDLRTVSGIFGVRADLINVFGVGVNLSAA